MNPSMRLKTIFAIGLMTGCLVMHAQAAPPTIVFSAKGIDELLDDADFIGDAAGQTGLKEIAETQIKAMTGGAEEDGIDRERPFGAYWSMVETDPNILGNLVVFLPLSDEEKFEALVRKFFPDLRVEDEVWSLNIQGLPPLRGTMSNDYFFISNSSESLSSLEDPENIVNADYDISLQVNLSSIPHKFKEMYLQMLEQGTRKSIAEGPKPRSPAEARGQELGAEWVLTMVKAVLNDGNRLTVGVNIDGETRLASVDLGLTGKPKSTLADAFAVYGKTVPVFAAVATENTPLSLVFSHPTSGFVDKLDELISMMKSSVEDTIKNDSSLKDDGDRKAANDVSNRMFGIAQATLKSGSLNSVFVLEKGDGETARIISGMKISKGEDAGKLWDDILKLSKESPDLAKVKTDADKHAGARIHAITPDGNAEQAEMFGDDPVHLAIRSDSLWMSLGGGNLGALKNALDLAGKKKAKPESPISLRTKPATLVTIMEKKDKNLVTRAEALAGEPGDILNLEIAPTDDAGVKVKLVFGVDLFLLAGDR